MRIFGAFSIVLIAAGVLGGCGTPGPPVAPETIGVTQKLLEEKEKERAGEAPRAPEAGEEVVLPPVRPVGTR